MFPFGSPIGPRHVDTGGICGKCRRRRRLSEPLDSHGGRTLNARHRWNGAVAQLGERIVRNDEVRGSIPLSSTIPARRPMRCAPPSGGVPLCDFDIACRDPSRNTDISRLMILIAREPQREARCHDPGKLILSSPIGATGACSRSIEIARKEACGQSGRKCYLSICFRIESLRTCASASFDSKCAAAGECPAAKRVSAAALICLSALSPKLRSPPS
jgi:hypothetical protein